MTCINANKTLSKILNDLSLNFKENSLSDEGLKLKIKELAKIITYLKKNCASFININILNKLEFLLRALKHFFKIRKSVDERIAKCDNLEELIKKELRELLEELQK